MRSRFANKSLDDIKSNCGDHLEGWSIQKMSVDANTVLVGKDAAGRLGTSLASLGDVDLDGFEDIAVGAPYGGEDGKGVVFIYNGVTKASILPGPSRGFGFSIEGGLDMDDDNKYPDMIVGAMHSDTAVLIRASPVIRLQGGVSFDKADTFIKQKTKYFKISRAIRSCEASVFSSPST
ncbi:Integrin alpha-V [Chionoecetes opilio]|uniref:Integrin alpha-V n=1 Tax=Chionoecetes opilio TaxID=41210 RepID=A0A8J4Y7D0_CHIOP|nr:Integrin alpha-V [Chionoecetes opilio]